MIPVKLAPKYYFVELISAMTLYMIALLSRRAIIAALPDIAWIKTLALLSPIFPICLAAWAICRFYRRMDEMHRKTMLENIAFAALFCAVGSISIGFLEDVGLPKVGVQWAWPLMGTGWLLICAWRGARWAVADQGFSRTAIIASRVVAIVGLPTLAYSLIAIHLGWPHKPGLIIMVGTAIFLVLAGYNTFRKDRG